MAEIRTLKDNDIIIYPKTSASAVLNQDGTTIATTITNEVAESKKFVRDVNNVLDIIEQEQLTEARMLSGNIEEILTDIQTGK